MRGESMVVMERAMGKPGKPTNGAGPGPTRATRTALAALIIVVGLGLIVADSLDLAQPPYQYILPPLCAASAWVFGVNFRDLMGRGGT